MFESSRLPQFPNLYLVGTVGSINTIQLGTLTPNCSVVVTSGLAIFDRAYRM